MARIRIKHFGPIREGVVDGDGWLYFDKVTVLIGDQATGKSSVAKLISTISWMEKALYRKELEGKHLSRQQFISKYCAYQGVHDYFKPNTEINYEGKYIQLNFGPGFLEVIEKSGEDYLPPKLMYVPAERNFLSVMAEASSVRNLPLPLYTFLEEFDAAKRSLSGPLALPISNVNFEYKEEVNLSSVTGSDYAISLHNASSGIQSMLPLYLVSKYLAEGIGKKQESGSKSVSLEQEQLVRNEVSRILEKNDLTEEVRGLLLQRLNAVYRNKAFVNIVEEPEQNLYPESQMKILFELLKFNNSSAGNKLLVTTHSPYVLNYLSLAVKAGNVLKGTQNDVVAKKVERVVPDGSAVAAASLHVYELRGDGSITRLKDYNGIPSDGNELNEKLAETNALFDQLLEIEEEAND